MENSTHMISIQRQAALMSGLLLLDIIKSINLEMPCLHASRAILLEMEKILRIIEVKSDRVLFIYFLNMTNIWIFHEMSK